MAWLRERYVVTHREDILARQGFLAGSDARRTHELLEALADPSVDAIVAARGGHGATRIVAHLDVAAITRARKLLVGFSDITALHALWAQAGVRAIHGAMIATLGRSNDPRLRDRWIRVVEGEVLEPIAVTTVVPGVAEGALVGGNLSVLAALVGTPYVPPLEGAVLFLEDVNEAPYRLDRLLTTLRNAGALRGVVGVALGQFTGSSDDASVAAVLADRLGDLGIPVVRGIPSGHVDDNLELPLGAPTRIRAEGALGTVTFLESAVARPTGSGVP